MLASWTGIAYDDDDHRTSEAVALAQPAGAAAPVKSGNGAYSYDALGRLTSAKHPFDSGTSAYALDDSGNVVRETGASSKADYYYGANRLGSKFFEKSEQVTENGFEITVDTAGRSVYTHDHLGDIAREQHDVTITASHPEAEKPGVETFSDITTTTYDAASHTRRVSRSDGGWVEYAYDALDRLVRRVEHPADGSGDTTTLFFHDGTSQQVALETNGSGTVENRYILDSGGTPLGQHDDEGRSYFVEDPRGNVSQLVGHDGSVKAVFGYDAFGGEREAHTATTGNWDSRLRFQTAPQDPKTGAYALGPRMYDPGINRFVGADFYASAAANMALQIDPLTGNRYLYAGANPVGLIDDGHGPGCGGIGWDRLRKHCANQWMQYRKAHAGRIGCGECVKAYKEFTSHFMNEYLPRIGAQHGYAADDLRSQAAEGIGRWYDSGPNIVQAVANNFKRTANRVGNAQELNAAIQRHKLNGFGGTVGRYGYACAGLAGIGEARAPGAFLAALGRNAPTKAGPIGLVLGCAAGMIGEWFGVAPTPPFGN